ncbi:MAG: hypothetical protein LBC03_06250 [Nitrososphaerota archaeon]|jgi:hypothetical protein|nr:hypothetical protein [Nitrososphaerota archaeon]
MTIDRTFVAVAVDLSRLPNDLIADNTISDIITIGREVDLLETVRQTERNSVIPLELLRFQASRLRIPVALFEKQSIIEFQSKKIVIVTAEEQVELRYVSSSEVYTYGLQRIREIKSEAQLKLLNLISKTFVKPILISELFEVLTLFSKHFRESLWNFLKETNVLIPFLHNNEQYVINHRLYKDPKKFEMAMQILEEQKLQNVVEFLQNNPGNPLPVVSQALGTKDDTLYLLSKYGLLEPLKLEVQGDNKEYLFSPNSTIARDDKDHFDLVKMTLANFRFGEYYSKNTRLYDLHLFFGKLLDSGYAGSVEAIGTDYHNLEKNGIVRVEQIGSNNYRFWAQKRDVIEDANNIIKGVIPFHSSRTTGSLSDINNMMQTRTQIDVEIAQSTNKGLIKALRDIQEGSLS